MTEVESWTPPAPVAPSSALAAGTSDENRRLVGGFLLGYEGNTRTAYARDLADWLQWLHQHGVEALDAQRVHVDAYARELAEVRALAPATVARRLAALAGFYAYALEEGLLARSPVAHVRRPRVGDDSQTTGLDRAQLRALLEAARRRAATGAGQSRRDLALVTLLADNGLRIGEALGADAGGLAPSGGTGSCTSPVRVAAARPSRWPRSRPERWTTTSPDGPPARCSPPPPAAA